MINRGFGYLFSRISERKSGPPAKMRLYSYVPLEAMRKGLTGNAVAFVSSLVSDCQCSAQDPELSDANGAL